MLQYALPPGESDLKHKNVKLQINLHNILEPHDSGYIENHDF